MLRMSDFGTSPCRPQLKAVMRVGIQYSRHRYPKWLPARFVVLSMDNINIYQRLLSMQHRIGIICARAGVGG